MSYDNSHAITAAISIALVTLFLWSSSKIDSSSPIILHHAIQNHEFGSRSGEGKLLCWILTIDNPKHKEKSQAVLDTWGSRCDHLIFVRNGTKMIEEQADSFTVLRIPIVKESRSELLRKTFMAFTHIYENYLDQYDWFMKADDDTYVLVDQLHSFLKNHSPKRPIYFGYKFKKYLKQGYMSGGAGYVLSRRALQVLVESGIKLNRSRCRSVGGEAEDLEIGACLEGVGVEAGDTRDAKGLPRFLALSPTDLLTRKTIDNKDWYFEYAYYPVGIGKNCCSPQPISFHYIDANQMYLIDWLLYSEAKHPTGLVV